MYETFVSIFDQFSYEPRLSTNGHSRFKSLIPSLLGLLTYSGALCIGMFFLIDTLNRNNQVVVFQDDPNIFSNIDLSNKTLGIGISNGTDILYDPTIFFVKSSLWSYSSDNKSNLIVKYTEYPLELCKESDFAQYNQKANNKSLCLKPDKNNITIYGKFGDIWRGYNLFNIFINKCINSTSSNIICKPPQVIDEYLKNIFVGISMESNYIDNSNPSNPFVSTFNNYLFSISSSIFKRHYSYLKNVLYITDVGLIFEEKITQTNYILGKQEVSVDMKIGAFNYPSTFGMISICTDGISLLYKRSYSKLQSVIANAGGALKALQTITQLISIILTERVYFQNLINSIYRYDLKEIKLRKDNFIENEKSDMNKINENQIDVYIKKDFMFLKNHEIKPSLLLSTTEKICPKLFLNEKKMNFYYYAKNNITKWLSYENLLIKLHQQEILKKIMLEEKHLIIFENIPKINLREFEESAKKSFNFIPDPNDKIVKKLLKYWI